MGELVRFLWQRLVVVAARRVGVERQAELIVPPELEAGLDSASSRATAAG